MKKISVNKLSKIEMEYAFAKHMGILLGDDTVFFKNDLGFFSVYHLRNFNVCNDDNLIKMVLKQKSQKIDVTMKNKVYIAKYGDVTAEDAEKNVAMIKAFLLFKAKSSSDEIEVPEKI